MDLLLEILASPILPPGGKLHRMDAEGRVGAERTRHRVLVVEDEALVAMDLAGLLDEAGYEVVGTVTNRAAAVAECRRSRPDLVLMDITLDDGDTGILAAEEISRQSDIHVLFVSALSDKATRERALSVGVGYVQKPYDPDRLIRIVNSVLKKG